MTTFVVNGMLYDYDVDALIVYVDSQHYGRAYECEWNPADDSLVVSKHWDESCVDQTTELPMDEAFHLYRFLDASDDVADAYARLSQEPAPVHGTRRSA